jgi:glutamine synthetase
LRAPARRPEGVNSAFNIPRLVKIRVISGQTTFNMSKTPKDLPEDEKFKFAVCDIDGILRGKILHRSKILKGLEDGYGFCNVIFGWDSADVCYDRGTVSGWHTGYPDAMARLDLNTFRRIPWENELGFYLGDFAGAEPGIAAACPRNLLRRIEQESRGMGYLPQFALEYEWFNFQETPQSLHDKDYARPQPITPGMFGYSLLRFSQNQGFVHAIFDQMAQYGVPLEGLHTETGPGVYEASIQYSPALEAADRAILFKAGVKELALQYGMVASFMAKWNEQLPGCGGHVHQNLWDEKGETNLFLDAEQPNRMSELLRHYLAGQLYCMPHIMPMYAPTVNSYKRLVKGSWAAVSVSWGIENRTAALRVIPDPARSLRLETRIPGADANPYLAVAASLASGLYGIKHRLPLHLPPVQGSAYEQSNLQALPSTLGEATQVMRKSKLAHELFGAEFAEHFLQTREWEWEQYCRQVSDWERRRYFEGV